MADFCIPKQLAEKLKEAAKAGEINIAKMYDMSSAERNTMFQKWVDKETASQINVGFEKAMISERQTALKEWAEKTFTGSEKKISRKKDIFDKIDSLRDKGILSPEGEKSFLSDLVREELGATVTEAETKIINEKSIKLQELSKEQTEFGTFTKEYFKAKRDMENYLDSLTPSSKLRIATSTIGRGTMLLSVKSPLLNIESNTVQGFLAAAERRVSNRSFGGVNGGYANRYIKFVNEVFSESGYDISRMESLDTGRRMLGEDVVNTQGPGKTRKIGRFYEDLVFKKLMSAPDVAFSSVHFADSANITSSKLSAKKGLKGEELQVEALRIFRDSTRIDPQTVEGQAVRAQAIADATYATYTNESTISTLALGIRKLFNIPSGDLRIGDQIMPFVKTPANVIGAGLDASGVFIPPETIYRMVKTVKAIHEGTPLREAAGENFSGFGRKIVRAGLGLTFAYILSTLFKPDDFIGSYPVSQKERKLFELKQATENSVKIGGKWVSLDYFGPLGTPLVGFLYAKKYGKDLPSTVIKYYQGVGKQAAKIPGFTEFSNTIEALKSQNIESNDNLTVYLARTGGNVFDFIKSRVIPAIAYDFAKATDQYERIVDKNNILQKLQNYIPAETPLISDRGDLPAKTNIFGENIKTEGWSTIFAGARVKTAGDGKLLKELIRLESDDNLPALTDPAGTDNGKILKNQLGEDKFREAMIAFGKYFKQDLEALINDDYYIEAPDDEARKSLIEKVKKRSFNYILGEYNFDKPTKEERDIILGK